LKVETYIITVVSQQGRYNYSYLLERSLKLTLLVFFIGYVITCLTSHR